MFHHTHMRAGRLTAVSLAIAAIASLAAQPAPAAGHAGHAPSAREPTDDLRRAPPHASSARSRWLAPPATPPPASAPRTPTIEYFQADADQDLATDPDRPVLFGMPFDGPMLGHEPGMPIHYDLHVWLYRHDPAGRFAMWNPRVHCPDSGGPGHDAPR